MEKAVTHVHPLISESLPVKAAFYFLIPGEFS